MLQQLFNQLLLTMIWCDTSYMVFNCMACFIIILDHLQCSIITIITTIILSQQPFWLHNTQPKTVWYWRSSCPIFAAINTDHGPCSSQHANTNHPKLLSKKTHTTGLILGAETLIFSFLFPDPKGSPHVNKFQASINNNSLSLKLFT